MRLRNRLLLVPCLVVFAASIPCIAGVLVAGPGDGVLFYSLDGTLIDELVDSDPGVSDPEGLAIDGNGKLYVASFGSNEVLRFDAYSGTFVDVFVASGSGGLGGAGRMRFGPDGNLYVASCDTDSVLRFSAADGSFIDAFVSSGSGELNCPFPIHFADEYLWVGSYFSDAILRYDATTGAFVDTFVSSGSGGLSGPGGITFLAGGDLLVSSVDTSSVLRYNAKTGSFVGEFATAESSGLDLAFDVALGPDGDLYVADANPSNAAVLHFNGSDGAFVEGFDLVEDNVGTTLLFVDWIFVDSFESGDTSSWTTVVP